MAQVRGVVANDTGEDLTGLINSTAERHGLPPELLLGLAIAESELNVQSQRWGRHSAEARAALDANDMGALESVVSRVEQETPGDISFGLFQQTVRWANEGDHTSRLANIFAIRDLYYQPAHAAEVAARQLGAHLRRFTDPLEALCRYNKPSLDGASNPHRTRYLESLERARGFLDGGYVPNGVPETKSTVQTELQLSPNCVPGRAQTIGVVIHSTRGNAPNLDREYRGTINHFLNRGSEVSAHIVVGAGTVCRIVADEDVAWHAQENNSTHLGIEIAQPRIDSPFTDFEYQAAADVVRGWCDKYGIPREHVTSQTQPGIIGHDETEQGRRIGKSDPGPQFDWGRFMALVQGTAAPVAAPSGGPLLGEGFRAYLAAHPDAGSARHDEAADYFGNTYVWLSASPSYSKGALLMWRKWLNRVKLISWEDGAAPMSPGTLEDYLAGHPSAGTPRHDPQTDVFENRYVWLSTSQEHPLGALVMWRKWLNCVQLIGWEDQPVSVAVGTNGTATTANESGGGSGVPMNGTATAVAVRAIQAVVSQCQVLRENYDSDGDYQLWAAPQSDGRFETASCSAAALAALLSAYGRPMNISGAIRLLGPGRISAEVGLLDASLNGMRDALASIGVTAERADLSYDELLKWLADGTPVILDLPGMFGGVGHILVALSGDSNACELADSARRERPRWSATPAELAGLSRRPDGRLAGLRIVQPQ